MAKQRKPRVGQWVEILWHDAPNEKVLVIAVDGRDFDFIRPGRKRDTLIANSACTSCIVRYGKMARCEF